MKQLVKNTSLYVEEQGTSGPALVFLHCWGDTHRTWNKVIAGLDGSHHTVTYDTRGWGQSEPGRGHTVVELANEAHSLIEQLALKTYVLVGHSMGGKMAQLLGSRRPEELAGLVLVARATPAPTRIPEEAFQQHLHAYDSRETILQLITFLCPRTPNAETIKQIVEDSLSGVPEAKPA